MDLNNCKTIINRSNYCSILKKRKSSYKENVTVKLKRNSQPNEGVNFEANTINRSSSSCSSFLLENSSQEKSNDLMCLICRSRNKCSTFEGKNCSSMATRLENNNIDNSCRNRNISNCLNCVVKTNSRIPSIPLLATKWNALKIANHKSQSQWNANSVNFGWSGNSSSISSKSKSNSNNSSNSSSSSSNSSSSSSSCGKSTMPSCQQQSSSFSSIPPTMAEISSTISSESSLSSSSLLLSSPSILLSSSTTATATATTTATTKTLTSLSSTILSPPCSTITATKMSASSTSLERTSPLSLSLPVPVPPSSSPSSSSSSPSSLPSGGTSSQLSSSGTNATLSCSVSTCTNTTTSTNTRNSTSGKNCAYVLKNASLTKISVVRTFALLTIMWENFLTGMFKTRQRMPQEHNEIDNQVKRPQSKRSNNYNFWLPKFPIMIIFLAFSLMTIMLPTSVSAEVRLQRNEKVCKSRDIRNSPVEFHQLADCTVIEGFLLITLINLDNHSEYEMYSFPMLTEVTEFVMIYRVNGLRTLSTLFPNLSVIRGKELFEGFALVIYENTHLEDVGLTSLTTVTRGAVRIEKNPALCFVETIDWTQIAVNMTSDQHFFRENKAKKECPFCPDDSEKSDGNELTVNCPVHQGERHCWNSKSCQKICPSACKNNCNDDLKCCDDGCIGGCAKNNSRSCTSCRHFAKMDVCMDRCPTNFFSYLQRRCVTADTCTKEIGTKLEGTKQEFLVPFDGVCSVRCPPGHNKINATCVKCEGKCVKKCEGGLIDSVAAAKLMHGCTHIINSPLSISIKRGGRHLMEDLELGLSSIEQIDTYLKVHRTYGMVSLAFFKNLKRIKGEQLESDKFALYVLENQDLESIWGPNQTVKMDEGRVFFHFNPKLCYSVIDALRPSLKNASQFDKNEVATDSNGSKGSCNTEVLDVKVARVTSSSARVIITNPMKFEDDRAFIGYQFFHTEDPYRNVSLFGHRPCDDGWSSEDPSKEIEHVFRNLRPFTQYAFYVKTHTISSEPRNGQSKILHFRTKPDQPKSVQNLKANSNSSSEIIVHWLRPTITNGNLTKYIISATLDVNDQTRLKSRNYCNDPLKEAATSDVGLLPFLDKSDRGLVSGNQGDPDCKCDKNVTRKDGSNPQMEEAIYENVIDFENNIQNFVYVKKTIDTPRDGRRRVRRAVDFYNALQEKLTPPSNQKLLSNSEGVSRMDTFGYYYEFVIDSVNASITEFVLTKLKHFSLYTIAVKACRAPEQDAPAEECSPESITYARTQKLTDVDVVRNLHVELERSNTTQGNLRIKWDPPERPNSLVVSYTIFYIVTNSPDAVSEKRCITELDYQQNFTNGYVITGLQTGNYSITVRANSLAGEGIKSKPVYKYIPPSGISWQTITFICIGLLVFVGIVAGVIQYVRKKFFAPPSDLKIFPTVNPYYISMQYLPDEWEVPRDKIIQLGALGQGSFGMVYEGILKNFSSAEDTPCAIKTVNENATDRERLNFLKEASVMKQFNTHHVVRLLGVCSRGQPALVIMELMKNGDLKAYLRQHRPDAESLNQGEPPLQAPTLERLLQIAIEIADGMAYLAAKKYVHRDLAARNCMVAADLTVKIGDFGMTRDIYETDYYRKGTKGLLPVRWMAPESLKDGVFSTASDVFSYGVVLWEMATLASQPYQGLSNDQVLRLVIDGKVMDRPENCPDKLYKLMEKCWQHRPSARPSFMDIIRFLLNDANPKFQEVSFYHSAEAKEMLDQMHPEHDMDDVTTPLRMGEFGYKSESLALDGDDEDEDDNIQPHSPYSLGSAIIISSTPGDHFKNSPNIITNQSNPSLSLPSTSAAALAASRAKENVEYIQPDLSYNYNIQQQQTQQQQDQHESPQKNTTQNPLTKKVNKKNRSSSFSSATSKYPNSFKRAVVSTVQNVSNSLVPLRIPNMSFLHHRIFKNSNNVSSLEGDEEQQEENTKSETLNNNSNNNNPKSSSTIPNVELGSTTSSRSFFSGLTPSHTSKNPTYQILDESLNVSAMHEDEQAVPPTKSQPKPRLPIGSTTSGDSENSHSPRNRNRDRGNNAMQQTQQPYKTTEQCNPNKDKDNLSTSINFKDTQSSQSPKSIQQIYPPLSSELSLNSDNKNPMDFSSNVMPQQQTTPLIAQTQYQLKENWLKQLPPNGFIGREG